jgi:RNA polymerase sigma-70 factor, ECF subfamily
MPGQGKESESKQFPVDENQALKIFEVLFKSYFSPLCKLVYRMVRDKALSEDLVQDVFLKTWNNRLNLDLSLSLKSYLTRAAVNTALNYLESQKKKYSIDDLVVEVSKMGTASVDHQVQYKELQRIMQDSLDLLPPKCKAVFILIKYEEMSYAEAARSLDISVKTVENQMGKALKHMRMHLQDYLGYMLMLLMSINE